MPCYFHKGHTPCGDKTPANFTLHVMETTCPECREMLKDFYGIMWPVKKETKTKKDKGELF